MLAIISNFARQNAEFMKLATLAQRNYIEPGRIAYNAAMYVAVEEHNGKEVLVCRPHASFLQNEAFMKIFSMQKETTKSFTSPNILQYVSYSSDSRGAFWFMSPGKYTSLSQLMADKPNLRLKKQWVDKTIASLIDMVEYVNSQGLCTLELTPKSILLTRDARHQVVLMPPLSDFVLLKNEIWTDADEQLPPELFSIEDPDQRADVYGIGRIISYLHPYPSLPFKYKKLVKKAVSEHVDVRPFTVQKMRSTIATRHKSGRATQIIVTVGVVAALLALLLFFQEKT